MIELRNLKKRFDTKWVTKGVTLEIPSGKMTCIIGRSGEGKSVLLKQVIGLIEPTSGEIIISGTDIIKMSAKPAIYEKGTAFMWTDKHIAQQLLNIHLNPDIDLASRKRSTIEKTAAWILDTQKGKGKFK